MNVDRFGVPIKIFGEHEEDFYGALGRVAALSALIEQQALGIFQTMTNSPQNEYTQPAASQLIKKACKALNPVGDDENKKTLLRYFTDIGAALPKRNDYIHNLWPAQPGNRLFGWRPNPDKKTRDDEPHVAIETNLDELKDFILTLVELILRRDCVHVSACAEQQLMLSPEAAS